MSVGQNSRKTLISYSRGKEVRTSMATGMRIERGEQGRQDVMAEVNGIKTARWCLARIWLGVIKVAPSLFCQEPPGLQTQSPSTLRMSFLLVKDKAEFENCV